MERYAAREGDRQATGVKRENHVVFDERRPAITCFHELADWIRAHVAYDRAAACFETKSEGIEDRFNFRIKRVRG